MRIIIPEQELYYVIVVSTPNSGWENFLRKSGRDGRGVWKTTPHWEYAERMNLGRAKAALKSVNVEKMKAKGHSFKIIEVEATHVTRKVWPLAPLEALAQVADKQ